MMAGKTCWIASLAGILLHSSAALCADFSVFDQFADAFDAGLFQGAQISSELTLESYNGGGSSQGVNVIEELSYNGSVVQVAAVEYGLSLILTEGDNVAQGVNVYRGTAQSVAQMAVISGAVTMTSSNSSGSIQGVNVITGN